MSRYARLICTAAVVALFAAPSQALEIFWKGSGVSGTLLDNNWSSNGTDTLTPTSGDILDFGGGGTATYSVAGPVSFQKLRVGHGQATPGGVGTGTVTISNGAQVNLTVGASGNANASLWVGNLQTGTLNIDGVGTSLTSTQILMIGYGNNINRNGTVNVTNGASLTALAGNVNIGDRTGGVGLPGHLNISGSDSIFNISGSGADLNIGVWATSSYSQTGGTATVADAITVGTNNATGSSFSVSGGTISSHSVTIGPEADNTSGSITGTAVVNVTTNNFNVGIGDAVGSSLLVSDTADINIQATGTGNGNMFIGRDTSKDTTFTMTGGTIDTGRNFLLGNATGATNIVGNQSGGTITTTLNFTIADTNGASTYNLSDAGVVVANDLVVIGRQGTGVMNQIGGSVTSAHGVTVGNAQDADTTKWAAGTYNVSGGTITANQGTGTALSIAPQGTGIFRVIGDDAVIDVNGNMTVNAGGSAQGTLAFQLETGDLLSLIDVSGIATFNAGAILWFDTSLSAPTQTTYDLLTAASIVDSGISKTFPANWDYRIIAGGNGQILQAFQSVSPGLLGDFNSDGKVEAGDYATWRKNEVANVALANDNGVGNQADRFTLWRANFGNPPGAGASLQAGQIPEPASFVLVLVGAAALVGIRRR